MAGEDFQIFSSFATCVLVFDWFIVIITKLQLEPMLI